MKNFIRNYLLGLIAAAGLSVFVWILFINPNTNWALEEAADWFSIQITNLTGSKNKAKKLSPKDYLIYNDHLDWRFSDLCHYFNSKGFKFQVGFRGATFKYSTDCYLVSEDKKDIVYLVFFKESLVQMLFNHTIYGFAWGDFSIISDDVELLKRLSAVIDNSYNRSFPNLSANIDVKSSISVWSALFDSNRKFKIRTSLGKGLTE